VNINATLLGQMITFALFVLFTMKYVWPPLITALHERQKKIADGLAAAERGRHDFELAQKNSAEALKETKKKANHIIEQANKQASLIVEEAQQRAQEERLRLLDAAGHEVDQLRIALRQQLRREVVKIALQGAEKVLEREIDAKAHHDMLNKLVTEL